MKKLVGGIFQSYFVRRLLVFVPTLLAVSVLTFGMSQCVAGDPVALHLGVTGDETGITTKIDPKEYEFVARKLGLDKPIFYGTIGSWAYPDTLFRFFQHGRRKTIERTIARYGNWQKIEPYFQNLSRMEAALAPNDTFQNTVKMLWQTDEADKMKRIFDEKIPPPSIAPIFEAMRTQSADFSTNTTRYLKYIPKLNIYGLDNQYHNWLKKILTGDFGINRKGESVRQLLEKPLAITMYFGLLTIFFSYAVALPLGVWLSFQQKKQSRLWVSRFIYFVYTLPTFSVATFLVIFFTNDTYGLKVSSVGLAQDFETSDGILVWLFANFKAMILPVLCFSVHVVPMVARQLRTTMTDALKQEYIKTARGKGLSERAARWFHAFPTALNPIFASLGQLFPLLVGGSMLIEVVFALPGMGSLMYNSILARDYSVVFAATFLLSFFTLLGSFLADLLHARFDPRIRFKKT